MHFDFEMVKLVQREREHEAEQARLANRIRKSLKLKR